MNKNGNDEMRHRIAETIITGNPRTARTRTTARERLAAVKLPLNITAGHHDDQDDTIRKHAELHRAVYSNYVLFDGGNNRVADCYINHAVGDTEDPARDLAEHQAAVALMLHAPEDLSALMAATTVRQQELAELIRDARAITRGEPRDEHADVFDVLARLAQFGTDE